MNPLTVAQPNQPSVLGSVVNRQPTTISIPQASNNNSSGPTAGSLSQQGGTNTGNSGSWWEKLLPTAGGIGGSTTALGIGALLAPETGGLSLIPAALLAGAGGAIGGAAGRAGENVATGQNVKNDLGSSAVENGLGSLVGEGVGEAAAKGVGALTGAVDKGTVNAIMQQAPKLIDRDTATYLAKNGITNLSKVGDITPLVTGEAGGEGAAFNNALTDTVNNSTDKVSIKTALQKASDPLQNSTLNPSTQSNAANAIQKSIESMTKDSGGDITQLPKFGAGGKPLQDTMSVFNDSDQLDNMSRGAVYNQATQFQKAAGQLAAKAPRDQFGNIADPQTSGLVNTYQSYGNELESKALGLGETDTALPIDEAAKTSMKNGIAPLQQSAPKLYQTLFDQIDNANTWKDIRSSTAPLVKASKALDAVNGNLNSVPGTTPLQAASSGPKGIVKSVLTSPTAYKGEAAGLGLLSKVTGKATASKIIPLLARTAAVSAVNLPNDVGAPTSASLTPGVTGTAGAGTINSGASTVQQNPLTQLYSQLLTQDQAAPAYFASTLPSTLNSLAPQIQKQQLAAPAISNLATAYANAGGAQGTLGGTLSRLTGLIPGTAANTYNNQSTAVASLMAQLLGITPEAAAASLPQLTQTQQTAAPQLSGIQSILGGLPAPAQ